MPTKKQFQSDLLASVKAMRQNESARRTQVVLPEAVQARSRMGMTQAEFAVLLGVSPRTLQDWEQGRRAPSGAARTLLLIAAKNPQALLDVA